MPWLKGIISQIIFDPNHTYWENIFGMTGAACLAVGSLDFDAFKLTMAVGYIFVGHKCHQKGKEK